MIGNRELEFADYLAIARRRIWIIIIPAVVVPVLVFLISLKIPNRYTSQTLVLVEQQKVPDSYVKPVVAEDLNQRLLTMQEQILSRTRLEPIIDKYNLYKNERQKAPIEDILDRMRKAVAVTPIKVDGTTRGTVPGFYISFASDNPRVAQQVCAEITSMFMDENLRARQQTAQGTTNFLISQLNDAKRNLDEQDKALAAFKSRYVTQLPERDQTNLTMLSTLNSQLDAVTQSITQAGQQKTYLESLLAQQVAAWKSKQVEGAAAPEDLERQRADFQNQLISLQTRYTADHPDVIKTKEALKQIDKKIAAANTLVAEGKVSPNKSSALEPAEIVQLRASIRQLDDVVKSKTRDQDRIQQEIRSYQARIQLSPMVEEQYKKLSRDYDTAQKFYDDLLKKRNESEMATELERQQQGEQFSVMDPPNLPEKPTFPNRLLITLGGLAAGVVIGIGSTAVLEMRDQSFRTEQEVTSTLKLPVLASIPLLDETSVEHIKRMRKKVPAGA
jgi:polysaccharide chain length determinant protein (PEP-CTERM system associated)